MPALSSDEREILRLYWGDSRSVEEIAGWLWKTEDAVKQVLYRLRLKFRKQGITLPTRRPQGRHRVYTGFAADAA